MRQDSNSIGPWHPDVQDDDIVVLIIGIEIEKRLFLIDDPSHGEFLLLQIGLTRPLGVLFSDPSARVLVTVAFRVYSK